MSIISSGDEANDIRLAIEKMQEEKFGDGDKVTDIAARLHPLLDSMAHYFHQHALPYNESAIEQAFCDMAEEYDKLIAVAGPAEKSEGGVGSVALDPSSEAPPSPAAVLTPDLVKRGGPHQGPARTPPLTEEHDG